ncbi:c-type cytochrome [Pseudothauera nasutitermitis]|uniref:C-type cytochrome n=1 Tax=Pseudothauera nasutitermitis TaxID=2565930 RepID=A0A4S4AUU4_9RHOO|nr:c-type cytochrome [Pseudothauera nasutitermitis]THF63574.1 c-type cytochrome [Pseudothauera nasutitermitis]
MKLNPSRLTLLVSSVALLSFSAGASAVDADAASRLFKKEDCTKCHAPARSKKGPSLKKIAEDHRGQADAAAKLIEHMKSGPVVKLEDGSEEEHRIIEVKDDAELQNLIAWILGH